MLIVTQDGAVLNMDHVAYMWIEAQPDNTWQIKADLDRWVHGRVLGTYKSKMRADVELEGLIRCYELGIRTFIFEKTYEGEVMKG